MNLYDTFEKLNYSWILGQSILRINVVRRLPGITPATEQRKRYDIERHGAYGHASTHGRRLSRAYPRRRRILGTNERTAVRRTERRALYNHYKTNKPKVQVYTKRIVRPWPFERQISILTQPLIIMRSRAARVSADGRQVGGVVVSIIILHAAPFTYEREIGVAPRACLPGRTVPDAAPPVAGSSRLVNRSSSPGQVTRRSRRLFSTEILTFQLMFFKVLNLTLSKQPGHTQWWRWWQIGVQHQVLSVVVFIVLGTGERCTLNLK